jgi:hypothetical protein
MSIRTTSRATFHRQPQGNQPYIRYSDDGGATFTGGKPFVEPNPNLFVFASSTAGLAISDSGFNGEAFHYDGRNLTVNNVDLFPGTFIELKPDTDYIITCFAKGSGSFDTFFWGSEGTNIVASPVTSELLPGMYKGNSAYGNCIKPLTSEWKLYEQVIHTHPSLTQRLSLRPVRIKKDTPSEIYIADIKLREYSKYIDGRNLCRCAAADGRSTQELLVTAHGAALPFTVQGLNSGDTFRIAFDWEVHNIVYTDGGYNNTGNKSFVLQMSREYAYRSPMFLTSLPTDKGHGEMLITLPALNTYSNGHPIREADSAYPYIHWEALGFAAGSYIRLSNLMVTKGDKQYPYAPAPEDQLLGTTPGKYMGTLVWEKPYPSLNPADYTWKLTEGRGIKSTTAYYALSSTPARPTVFSTDKPTLTSTNKYLWQYLRIEYDDGLVVGSPSDAVIIGVYGEQGDKGDSITIVDTSTTYQASSSGTGIPNGTWQDSIPTVGQRQFLWTKVTIIFSDGKSATSYTVSRQGGDGAAGTSVTVMSSTVSYQASTLGTGVPTGTWLPNIPTVAQGQFLWTRTVVLYSDGKSTTSYTVSRQSKDGTSVSVVNTAVHYQASTNGTDVPTGNWVSPPPTVPQGQYLWTRTVVTYSSGPPSTTYTVSRQGKDGLPGADGISVLDMKDEYYLSTSPTALAGGSWSNIYPGWQQGKYLWKRTHVFMSDNTDYYTDAVCISGSPGSTGNPGADAYTIYTTPTAIIVDTNSSGLVTSAELNNANAYVTPKAFKGGQAVTVLIDAVSTSTGIGASITDAGTRIKVNSIGTDPSTGNAYGSGYVDATLRVDGKTFTVRIPVGTNVHKVASRLVNEIDEIGGEVDSMHQEYNDYRSTTNARFAAVEGQVNLRVKQTEYDANKQSVQTQIGQVTVQANQISMKLSNLKSGAVNLLDRSGTPETSASYYIHERDFNIVEGHEYTLTVSGRVSQETKNEGGVLRVHIHPPGWAWTHAIDIDSVTDVTKNLTFVAPETKTVRFRCVSFKSQGVPSKNVTLNWAVITEGNVGVGEWIPSAAESTEQKLRNIGIDINGDGSIDMQADKFTLRNLDEEAVLGVNSDGDMEVRGVIRANALLQQFREVSTNPGSTVSRVGECIFGMTLEPDANGLPKAVKYFPPDILLVRTPAGSDIEDSFLMLPYAPHANGRVIDIYGENYNAMTGATNIRTIVLAQCNDAYINGDGVSINNGGTGPYAIYGDGDTSTSSPFRLVGSHLFGAVILNPYSSANGGQAHLRIISSGGKWMVLNMKNCTPTNTIS